MHQNYGVAGTIILVGADCFTRPAATLISFWLACEQDELVSRISRKSIDLLKEHFRDDMSKDDWRLVVKLKSMFDIS